MGTKSIFILFVFFFVSISFINAQTQDNGDCYKSFLKTYAAPGGVLEVKDVSRVSDKGYILSGFRGPAYNPVIIKLNQKAEVEWSKTYTGATWANKVLQTDDGNFIVASFSSSRSQLTKLSNSGTLIWSKEFTNLSGYNLHLYDIQKTDNGGFVLIFNSAYGLGYMFSYIMRLDAAANIIWKKEIVTGFQEPMVKSLLVNGSSIFIAADFYNSNAQKSIDVARIDLMSGDFIWKKRFETNSSSLFDPHLALVNDTLCVSMVATQNITPYPVNMFSFAALNAGTGNLLSAIQFTNPVLAYNVTYYAIYAIGPFHFNSTGDNNLFTAQLVYHNKDTVLNVTKFTTTGNIIWSKNYKNYKKHDVWSVKSDNDELLIAGRRYVGFPNTTDVGFLMRLKQNGNIVDQILPPTADCYNESVTVATQTLLLTEMASSNFTSTTNYNEIVESVFQPQLSSAIITSTESCHTVDSSCNSLTISGPSLFCVDSSVVTFTATRNKDCSNPVTWFYDTAFVTQVNITDSSISVKFKKTGAFPLTAKLNNNCSTISVIKPIQVYRKANSLHIGTDRAICFPDTVQLNAQKGFLSYLWNNGSQDSSITVTTPGIYYVDVVDSCGTQFRDSVTLNNAPSVQINLGQDRQKCNNDTLQLNAPAGFVNYYWGPNYNLSNPTPTRVIVNPVLDTFYFVKVEMANGCFGYDTVKVKVNTSPVISLGTDTSFCSGDSMLLNAGNGFSQYQWSLGNASQQINVYSVGQYSVIGTTAQGCKSYDTIRILSNWPTPKVSLVKNPELCLGTTKTIDAGNFVSYLWNDGSTARTLTVNQIGTYSVIVTDNNGCVGSDTTSITALLPLPAGFLPADTSICTYDKLTLKPEQGFRSYLWDNNSTNSTVTITKPGMYWLRVTDQNNCIGTDTILVAPKDCLAGIYVPNAFTPNNDNLNDVIYPIIGGTIVQCQFSIFNRWGKLVFTTNELGKGWNGRFAGYPQDPGLFTWKCTYQLEGEKPQTAKGFVTLIR